MGEVVKGIAVGVSVTGTGLLLLSILNGDLVRKYRRVKEALIYRRIARRVERFVLKWHRRPMGRDYLVPPVMIADDESWIDELEWTMPEERGWPGDSVFC